MKRRMIQLGRYGVCYFFMLCSIGCSRLSDQLGAQKRKHTAFTAASSNAVSRSGRQRDSNRTAIFTWGTFLRVLMLGSVLQPTGPTNIYGVQNFNNRLQLSDDAALEELHNLFFTEKNRLGNNGKNLNMVVSYINMQRELIKVQDALESCESNQGKNCRISLPCSQPVRTPTPTTTPCPPPKNCDQAVMDALRELQPQSKDTVPVTLYTEEKETHRNCTAEHASLLARETHLNSTIQKLEQEKKFSEENLIKCRNNQAKLEEEQQTFKATDIRDLQKQLDQAKQKIEQLEKKKNAYEEKLAKYLKDNVLEGDCEKKETFNQDFEQKYKDIVKQCIDSTASFQDIFRVFRGICNPSFNANLKTLKQKCTQNETDRKKRSVSLYMDGQKAESSAQSKRPTQGQSRRGNPLLSKKQSHR